MTKIKKNNIITWAVYIFKQKIKDNYVYVNDERADDLITEYSGIAGVKINLKPNEYFVLGDNRKNSIDSRFKEIGIINKKEIRGKILNQKNNIIAWAIYS